MAHELAEAIAAGSHCPYALVGIVRGPKDEETGSFPCPVLGSLENLESIVVERQPEVIVVSLAERRQCLPVYRLLKARIFQGLVVENAEAVYERLTGKLAIDSLTPSSVIFSKGFRPSSFAQAVERGIGVLAAVVGLIGFAPFLGLIAAVIKCESRGPVFFVQTRIGLGGKRFQMYKFRTMYPDENRRSEWVRDNSDRITRVGRWLRRHRLDEWPQFINVLRGDMNLVGPRPHPVSNQRLFTLVSRNIPECGMQIPYYSLRSLVRPGITGWAQTHYRYANDLDEEMEKLRYDLYYIKHHSVRLDLRILLETVKVIVTGREVPEATIGATQASPATGKPVPPEPVAANARTAAANDAATAAEVGFEGNTRRSVVAAERP